MDQDAITQRVNDAIISRQLQTPKQVSDAINQAKAEVQKLVAEKEKEFSDYRAQDAIDDAAAAERARLALEVEAQKLVAARNQAAVELAAAVSKGELDKAAAVKVIQDSLDRKITEYNNYVAQDATDDAAVLARAAADLKTATDKAAADLMASEKAGTNKMLIAAGAVAAVAVLAMIVMRKKE